MSPSTRKEQPLLGEIGISESEEQVYRALLGHRMATATDISRVVALAPRKTQQLLDAIETKGLATRSPERPRRYIPTSPDIAVEALVRQRQDALDRTRASIQILAEQAASAKGVGEREQVVELLTSNDAARQAYEHLQRTSQREAISLQRPPIVFNAVREIDEAQAQALARGVRVRSIADARLLEQPGVIEHIRGDIAAGEDVRIHPQLPLKLVAFDRRAGLIPLNLEQPEGAWLVLRSSALLDALYALFDILWERATPIAFARSGTLETGGPSSGLPAQAERLIQMLAAGLNDKAITHELDVSISTLNRRVAELMNALGTRTRFQMGWQAALRMSAGDSGR